jgi:DNA polymerase kappa
VNFRTFHALSDSTKILEKLQSVASDLEEDLARTGWAGQTITLKYKLDTYQGDSLFGILAIELELSRG